MLTISALASPAAAAALTTRSAKTSTPDGDGELVARAACHKGERVVSGGYRIPDESYATVSRANYKQTWSAHVRSLVPNATLTVYAYCHEGLGVSHNGNRVHTSGQPSSGTEATATCPSGEGVVSGGYELGGVGDSNGAVNFRSRRTGDRTWGVLTYVASTADLKAFAYCQPHADVKVRSKRSDPLLADGHDSATAHCHAGEELLSGGYTTTPTPDWTNAAGPNLVYNRSSRSGKRAWTAAAHNDSSVPGRITAYAYCRA